MTPADHEALVKRLRHEASFCNRLVSITERNIGELLSEAATALESLAAPKPDEPKLRAILAELSEEDQHTMRRALAAAPLPTSPWQTMESAPKDGTRIWVISNQGYQCESCYLQSIEMWQNFAVTTQWPTHWQPLPAPPTEQDKP